MIFNSKHLTMILAGSKTQTRRDKCRYRVGRDYALQPGRLKPGIGQRIKILDVHKELLGDIDVEGARAEGYPSIEAYKPAWEECNKRRWDPGREVFVITFKLVAA